MNSRGVRHETPGHETTGFDVWVQPRRVLPNALRAALRPETSSCASNTTFLVTSRHEMKSGGVTALGNPSRVDA